MERNVDFRKVPAAQLTTRVIWNAIILLRILILREAANSRYSFLL